ncbi:TolC family protein (plasmid) [Rahnella variigena]|uniref:TolC family protein n=1 Tax=Rahnella variigena TaxID=574964 RepID=UPI003CE9067E
MTRMKKLTFLLSVVLLAGCHSFTQDSYQRPSLSLVSNEGAKNTGQSWLQRSPHWWKTFNDPLLSQAIEQVLVSNNDLAAAGIRLHQARLDAGLTRTNLTPDVSVSGNASNSKNTRKMTDSQESYSASVELSYEIDLWGKLAKSREQSEWLVRASEMDRQNTALLLIGNTAQFYWQIANLNQQIRNTQNSVLLAKRSEAAVLSRFNAGSVSQLDLLQAHQQVIDLQTSLRDQQQQRQEARNSLAILFNRSPSQRVAERTSLDLTQIIALEVDQPLEVIAHRPDIQAAEMQLRASLAGTEVAKLNFYPTISLSAALGASSDLFRDWFSNPARTLGSSVALPFVQWNTVQLTVERADLDAQQAALTFQNKVYTALSDVDKAMTQRETWQLKRQAAAESKSLNQRRLELAQSQYLSGAVPIDSWLDAQSSLLNAENTFSDSQYGYLNTTMQLWLALGGETILELPQR